jgi:hypothetical protein
VSSIWLMPDGSRWDIPDGNDPPAPQKPKPPAPRSKPTRPNYGSLVVNPYVLYGCVGQEGTPSASTSPAAASASPVPPRSAPEHVRQFLRKIGQRGGQARAARHSRDEIAAWGRVRRKSRLRGMR